MAERFNVKDKRVKLRKISNNKINYVNDIYAPGAQILRYRSLEALKRYIPELVMATWNEDEMEFSDSLTDEDRLRFVIRTLQGKFIPTALRSINITFRITGMSSHDVTHLIRTTGFSYAADCTGDKVMEGRPVILPEFINKMKDEDGVPLFDYYHQAMGNLMHIYDVAMNSGEVHLQDARLMLPRTLTTWYYVTGGLDTVLRFISQRIDRQVQPKADNIIAMLLAVELTKILPIMIDVDQPNNFYIKETPTNFKSGWEKPLPQNVDKIPVQYQNADNFLYGNKSRDEMIGNEEFVYRWNELKEQLTELQGKWMDTSDIADAIKDCTDGDWK